MKKFFFRFGKTISLFWIIFNLLTSSVQAAQRIYFNLGFLKFSISVKSLESFAKEGEINPELAFILDRLTPQQQSQLREFLRTRYNISAVKLYRLGNSYAGDQLINLVGKGVQIQGGRNGYYPLRGSIITSANTPDGISVINVIKNFSTNIELDVNYLMSSYNKVQNLARETKDFMAHLKEKPALDSLPSPEVWSNLSQPGEFSVSNEIVHLSDSKRKRSLKVFFHIPETNNIDIPVIFISGGLGSDGDRFSSLASHLASHGFLVVIPEHPNSNSQRQRDFYEGLYKDPFDSTEFIDRPLDITFLLDYLEKVNSRQFQGRLNLEQAGIFGYSFGSTTALALAGAEINFERLEKHCHPPDSLTNISILYQCRGLELPKKDYQLEDNRIQAIFSLGPFGKHLYGSKELNSVDIPIFWQTSSEDVITPLLIEQLPAFSSLPKEHKYLVIAEKLPHAQIILNAMNKLSNQSISKEKVEEVTQKYVKALSLAFLKVYITQDEEYRPYLQSNYIQSLTEQPFDLFFLNDLENYENFPILQRQLQVHNNETSLD